MWARDCTTKWFNGVNSLGMLPTEVDDLDKVDLIPRPSGLKKHQLSCNLK